MWFWQGEGGLEDWKGWDESLVRWRRDGVLIGMWVGRAIGRVKGGIRYWCRWWWDWVLAG